MLNIRYEDVVRLMPTDMLASVTANNSMVDMWKYCIGSNELAFRERYEKWFNHPYPVLTKEEFEEFKNRVYNSKARSGAS